MSLLADSGNEVLYLIGGISSLAAVVAILFKYLIQEKDAKFALLLGTKDQQLQEEIALKLSFQKIAEGSTKSALDTANFYRGQEGKAPLVPLAPVVPNSNSPSTARQREIAEVDTLRATLEMIRKAMGQPPEKTPIPGPN